MSQKNDLTRLIRESERLRRCSIDLIEALEMLRAEVQKFQSNQRPQPEKSRPKKPRS
jgi:hypothetical protein